MISTLAIALLIALGATGIVICLALALSSSYFRLGILHYLAALLCVVVSTVFLTAALGARKAMKALNTVAQNAQVVAGTAESALTSGGTLSLESLRSQIPEQYQGLVDLLPKEALPEISLPSGKTEGSVSAQYIEQLRAPLARRLRSATIWSIVVTVVLNLLLLLLLVNAGSKARPRRRSSEDLDEADGDFGSLSSVDEDLDFD